MFVVSALVLCLVVHNELFSLAILSLLAVYAFIHVLAQLVTAQKEDRP